MAEITSTTKNFVLGSDNVTYFEVTRVTYDDDTYNETSTRVGDAASLTADQADKIESRTASMAGDTRRAMRTKNILNEINSDAAEIAAITGINPVDTIKDRHIDDLTQNGWTIDDGTGELPIVFSVNGQGVLKYNINGTGTKNALIYGAVIQLKNYPGTGNTEFFLNKKGNKYEALPNKAYTIKHP